MASNETSYETATNKTVEAPVTYELTTESRGDDDGDKAGLQAQQIGIIVGVLVVVLLITAVVLFFIFRKRMCNKKSPTKATGTSEVYADTTAPLDEESKEMLKSDHNGTEQIELESKEQPAEVENTNESSPLKENPSASVAAANESSITLVNDDGNEVA